MSDNPAPSPAPGMERASDRPARPAATRPGLPGRIAADLEEARARSLALLDSLPEPDLLRQHSPLMSPLVWDLAHVANYEDQWLTGALAQPRVAAHLDDVYDAFAHPRADRPALPLLHSRRARHYAAAVRARALDVLDGLDEDDLSGGAGLAPLLDRGFVYGMVVQHEHQHDETMLATLQLRGVDDLSVPDPAVPDPAVAAPPARLPAEVMVEGGPFEMGTSTDPWAYDNERPAHVVDVAAFYLDTTPVTNARYLAFMDDGGYRRPELWADDGWEWRQGAGVEAPGSWEPGADGWGRCRFGRLEPVPHGEPVQHVCWYEADAYARWAGRRLPTEAEWEKAASWDPAAGRKLRHPWGHRPPDPSLATLWGSDRWRAAPAGSLPAGVAPCGAQQLVGDVWEWTASEFRPYPGFSSFPYPEYSEVFWAGGYKVLRGGSWATHASAVRATFRNWDHPIRRQIFAGFRTARDAGPDATRPVRPVRTGHRQSR